MFSKTESKSPSAPDTDQVSKIKKESKSGTSAKAPSIISADMSISGDLSSEGEVQVDGTIKGDLRCAKLTIGEQGTVEGTVTAERALLRGKIIGEIEAQSVTLMSTATVIGDITHEALTIEPGAYIEGHCRRIDKAAGNRPVRSGKGATIDFVVTEPEANTA